MSLHLSVMRFGLNQPFSCLAPLPHSCNNCTFSFLESSGTRTLMGPCLTLLPPHSLGNLVVWEEGSLILGSLYFLPNVLSVT